MQKTDAGEREDRSAPEGLDVFGLRRLEVGQFLQDLNLRLRLRSCIDRSAPWRARRRGLDLGRTSIGVVAPSVNVGLEMLAVRLLRLVLFELCARTLGLGRVELAEVALVAVENRSESSEAESQDGEMETN